MSAIVERSRRVAKTAIAARRKSSGTAGWTGGEKKTPAVMPAQSAIAGIAAGQRTTARQQTECRAEAGSAKASYSALAAISAW
jgi:hypothetical protein